MARFTRPRPALISQLQGCALCALTFAKPSPRKPRLFDQILLAAMRIAFYAPLKSPCHPVPSGDRLMARLLMEALQTAGHEVDLVSEARVFLAAPDAGLLAEAQNSAVAEDSRIRQRWHHLPKPDLWFTYHPYYKSPDLLGPKLAADFGLPYVTAESSWSARRTTGDWGQAQALVRAGLQQAALNICLTARDAKGIADTLPQAALARLAPFIDTRPFAEIPAKHHGPEAGPCHLVTVAMMRPGDKLESYLALARALRKVTAPWRLTIAGDGPEAATVKAAFADFAPGQVVFLGALSAPDVAALLSDSALYVWPGHGEAYGLAYLEAQASGLPVLAEATAGVPEVVQHGQTGLLTPPGDTPAYARALTELIEAPATRLRLGQNARHFALTERSLAQAARHLDALLSAIARPR